MNIKNLFKLDYWFGQPFAAEGKALWILLGLFLLVVFIGLVFKVVAIYQEEKFKKIIFKRLANLDLTMGFIGLVWLFFRQENVSFLAWRFWLLLWLIGAGWWKWTIIRYMIRRVPDIKEEQERLARIEKYLPKSNK